MLKAYKYRIYPTESQKEIMWKTINGCRFVYNWALEQRIAAYKNGEKTPSVFDLNKCLTEMKQTNAWLYECSNPALQFAIRNMDSAYVNFFRRVKQGKGGKDAGFPRFKSKKNPVQSFQFINNYRIDLDGGFVKIPKIKEPIKLIVGNLRFDGVCKTATVSVTSTDKWFISILVDDGNELPYTSPFNSDDILGLDLGLTDIITTSRGVKVSNPKHLKNSEKRLVCLQRRLSRKQKGSSNRKKAIKRVAKCHEKISNQRSDFLHKLSYTLVSENQAIAIEDLNVKGMMKNSKLAKHIGDASWFELVRQLEYKSEWYGKALLKIGRFDPSSKTCSNCMFKIDGMPLNIREWICPECGAVHDRDVNAAINIKNLAISYLMEYSGADRSGEPVESWSIDRAVKQELQHMVGTSVP